MEKLSLYEINEAIETIFANYVDHETGEISREGEELLNGLQLQKETKIVNIGMFYKNLQGFVDACKEEKKRIDDKQKSAEKKLDWLKSYIEANVNGEKINTPQISISYRKSSRLEVDDNIDLEMIEQSWPEIIRTKKEIDKTSAKKLISGDVKITGMRIIESNNIQIK